MLKTTVLVLILQVYHFRRFIQVEAQSCPNNCRIAEEHVVDWVNKQGLHCQCPGGDGRGSPCSWVGYGGTKNFPLCLDTIPTGFDEGTCSIFIKHLRSSKILERSFSNVSSVLFLGIQYSNVSMIQPGAFLGLSSVERLYLDHNRISSLGMYKIFTCCGVQSRPGNVSCSISVDSLH